MRERLTEVNAGGSSFWDVVREDWVTNGRDQSKPGFRALFMYRFGVWRAHVESRALRAPLSLLYRWMHRYVRNHYGIELHSQASIGRRVRIAHQGGIVIHEYARIGDDCLITQGVTIGAAGSWSDEEAPEVGCGVSIGAGAKILGPVRVGDGARIGPNAVVLANVPEGAIATAAPARIISAPRMSSEDDKGGS